MFRRRLVSNEWNLSDDGRFSVKQEKGVHAFHRMYGEWMKD